MLEFMDGPGRPWAANDMGAELRLVAETSLKKEERAQASFDLCLLSAAKFVPGESSQQDDPLVWLMQASILGNKQALTIGRRIFEACQLPAPDVFASTTGCVGNVMQVLDESTPVCYYSNAVRLLWSEEIQRVSARRIKELSKSKEPFHGNADVDLCCQFKEVNSAAVVDESFLLHLAVCIGTADDLTNLLGLGSGLNKRTPEGLTALHLACIYANIEMVAILARYGADASINDTDDVSPLHWIVLFQEDDIFPVVEILTQAGAKINSCVGERGRKYFDDLGLILDATPLWWAILCRNHSAISALVSHGAELFHGHQTTSFGLRRSCCIDASLGTVCSDTLALLLESSTLLRDLTVNEKEMCQLAIGSICSNPFQRWCMHGPEYEKAYSRVLSVLRHFDMRFTYRWPALDSSYKWRYQHQTPLENAAHKGDLHLVKALILDGDDVNFRPEKDSLTAIESLLSNNWIGAMPTAIEVVEFLLDSGADDNPIPDISTPEAPPSNYNYFNRLLQSALCVHAPVPILQVLLRRAPRETYYGWLGRNILGLILEEYEEPSSIRLASMFLDSGTDPNAEDKHESSDWNCCHTAAAHGVRHWSWAFTRMCLDRGSSLEYGACKGHRRSLVHLAVRSAFEAEFRFTEDKDKARDRKRAMNFLSDLLSHPASKEKGIIDMPDFQGITPLMWAVFWTLPSCVAVLVENGAETMGKWVGKSLPDLVDVCKTFSVPEGFDISNDVFTQQIRTLELLDIFPYLSKATFLKRLDEISLFFRRWDSAS